MNMTKREFFRRKNRASLYNIYENAISRAYDLSERYLTKVNILRNRKNDFQTGSHIWILLNNLEKDITSSFEYYACLRCNSLKQTAFKVNMKEYDEVILDTQKLANAIGKMETMLDIVDYMERNTLKMRAK